MPYSGELRSMGLAKEVTIGTFVLPPTRFLAYVPPANITPYSTLLSSKGIRAVPDIIQKVRQGPISLNGQKIKIELEPENCGEILQACFGADTKTGVGPYTHVFARTVVSQLPTYTLWVEQGAIYTVLGGCMLNKLTIDCKAKELVMADTEWTGTTYQAGVTETQSYSTLQPFSFSDAVLTLGGGVLSDFDDAKIEIDNKVKADHAINNSLYPAKIYSEGMEVNVSMSMFVESGNIAQWSTNFLTAAAQTFDLKLTSPQLTSGTHYSLDLYAPVLNYKTAPFNNPQSVLKIPFAGWAVYDLASTLQTFKATLINSVSTTY